jgi:Mg-chelatase subunit ChlD
MVFRCFSRKNSIFPGLLVLALFVPSLVSGADVSVKTSRTLDTVGTDTFNVRLRFFAQGRYDTLWKVDTTFDTTRVPLDIVLSIDLSNSMDSANGTAHSRIIWAKAAALGFLDSLKNGDRVAILGWTSTNTGILLADSAVPTKYYQKWSGFTADYGAAAGFIRDSLFLDGNSRTTDTVEGRTLVVHNIISTGQFGNTPMHIASVMALSRLSALARSEAKKVVIMLSDGENNDGVPRATAVAFIDSMFRTRSLQFNTIGFMQGDTLGLHALATAGGGYFYNAVNSSELDSAYAKLANMLVDRKIDTSYATKPIQVSPDTVRAPLDVILAIDLSSSMESIETGGLTRIQMAKSAALGFLDSLKPQDRVSVMGWTSASGNSDVFLSDTANRSVYYQKWCAFTSNVKAVKSFIADSINPNDALYGYTPLRISSVVAMKHLSSFTRAEATKVVIMLSDGGNNDGEPRSTATVFLDSLRRTRGLQFHTIGFMDGDTVELHALAIAGGGNFYNAQNNGELQNAYASLAHQIIQQKLAARKLMIQEVINHPPLNYVAGSQHATAKSTVPLQSFESLVDASGNTVLRWYFTNIPIWGVAEVSYSLVTTAGLAVAVGVDSAHTTGGFWSRMVYTDDQLSITTINLSPTGNGPPVFAEGKGRPESPPCVSFRKDGIIRVTHAVAGVPVTLTLITMNGRIAFCDRIFPGSSGDDIFFRIPKSLAKGVYALRIRRDDAVVLKMIRLMR